MTSKLIGWLKRQDLIQKGLRCDRTRKQIHADEGETPLDHNPYILALIFVFAYVASIRIGLWNSTAETGHTLAYTGMLFCIALLLMPILIREVWHSNRLIALTLLTLLGNLLINKALSIVFHGPIFTHIDTASLLLPSALAPMLITILIHTIPGVVIAILLSIANLLYLDPTIETLSTSLITGLAGVYFARNIRRRSHLLMAGSLVGFVGFLSCMVILATRGENQPLVLFIHGAWALALGITTVFVIGAILPILEWTFDRITDISWLELTDLNHPLLKQLTLQAPGTYHHSLMVANLAEAAAETVGANPTQCRVLAYFHDVGKLTKPEYFIENSSPAGNPHHDLSPSMSALIIIGHVKEGIDLAIKHNLPKPILDTIRQHHGTSLVYYFYRKAVQQAEDARLGSEILGLKNTDLPEVEEASFRYPGPIPQFKEAALVSMADAIESASRNLRQPTHQTIESLVNEIIRQRVDDGQLNDSGLTLHEIQLASEKFSFTLKTMLHSRIEYPKDAKQKTDTDRDKQPPKTPPPTDTTPQKTNSTSSSTPS